MATSLRVLMISGLLVAVFAGAGSGGGDQQDWRDDYWSGRQMRAEIRQQVRDALREARSAIERGAT